MMDTSIRRIVITEDEDLDLDKLLLGDNSGARQLSSSHLQSPPRSLPTSSSLHSSSPSLSANKTTAASAVEERCIGDETTPTSPGPILARDEGWILPTPAQPGDYINTSLRRVPSKSILKKTSSYGNFDSLMLSSKSGGVGMSRRASSCSLGRQSRGQVGNSALDSSLSGGVLKVAKRTSYLSLDLSNSQGSGAQHVAIGWDLDDSLPSKCCAMPASSSRNNFIPPGRDDVSDDGDRTAGIDSSGSRHSGTSSAKIRRNVSFNSVDIREYDRTIGDNPSCRSGPPMSLDWSYSKNYEKKLDEYELERSSERVNSLRKLHVNKWKRRNMLTYQWGHTEDEMKEARRNTKKMQRQRSMTKTMMPMHFVEEAFMNLTKFITKKTDKGDGDDDWSSSDLSNSASTKDSTHRYKGSPQLLSSGLLREDTIASLTTTDTNEEGPQDQVVIPPTS
mmetsp:Transcript_33279/g.80487  ORF Transcript_33279/g.80487 Transcript_33279/m.80487 type:complete len:448 (+) Transcript_33279:115-1458(+)